MRWQSFFCLFRYPLYLQHLCWRWQQGRIVRHLNRLGVKIGAATSFLGAPIVSMERGSRITISGQCLICSQSERTVLGVNHVCVLRTLRPQAVLLIGHGVRMSGTTICAAQRVEIGDHVVIGANVTIVDTDFHAMDPAVRSSEADADAAAYDSVCIENDVFIGMHAIILKGVRLGRGSVVAAGAVVTRGCPPYSIVGGNPARLIGQVKK